MFGGNPILDTMFWIGVMIIAVYTFSYLTEKWEERKKKRKSGF